VRLALVSCQDYPSSELAARCTDQIAFNPVRQVGYTRELIRRNNLT